MFVSSGCALATLIGLFQWTCFNVLFVVIEDLKMTEIKKSEAKKSETKKSECGYMYIGHLPHGFYEKQVRGYFSQFGRVKRLRLARSPTTGKHKGYGFIEFESEAVAKVAADTMNNYLMFNKILKCQVIPKDKLHPLVFRNSRKLFKVPVKSLFRRKYNRTKSTEQVEVSILCYLRTIVG